MAQKHIQKIPLCLVMFVGIILIITGCGKKTTNNIPNRTITSPRRTSNMNNLSDNTYYILHQDDDGVYYFYPMYSNEKNFTEAPDRANPTRVMWFGDDYAAIPTFRQGDQIVLKTVSIPGSFTWERFKYNGYTFGFCGAYRNSNTGQYYIDTEFGTNICRASSASPLLQLRDYYTMIYSIGGVEKLGPGNFMEGGAMAGLEKGAKYKCVFARGSMKYTFNLTADVRELTSMDVQSSISYKYLDHDLISIQIPKEFKTGYYSINNQGIFRYLTGDEFDEETNYNIPNDRIQNETPRITSKGDTNYKAEEKATALEYPLKVESNKPVTIKITYEEYKQMDQDPIVKVIGSSYVITMTKKQGENRFEETYQLPIGDYTIQIIGTNNRTFIVTAE